MGKAPRDAGAGDRVRVTYEATLVYSGRRPPEDAVELGQFDGVLWWVLPNTPETNRKIVNAEVLDSAPRPSGVAVTNRDGGRYTFPAGNGWYDQDGFINVVGGRETLAAFPVETVLYVALVGAEG